MTGEIERVAGFVKHSFMKVDRHFLLFDRLLGLQVEEQDEAVVSPAGAEQPVAFRMKLEVIDQTIELVAGKFDGALAGFPIEDLDSGFAFQVIDVPDLANATDSEQRSIRRKRQR